MTNDTILEPLNSDVFNADEQFRKLTNTIYLLQSIGFIFGLTFIAAVIMNYVKKDEVAGTWLESHFRWQIRTFWWSACWSLIGIFLALVVVGYFILIGNAIWTIYRVVKGWMSLRDGKQMYLK